MCATEMNKSRTCKMGDCAKSSNSPEHGSAHAKDIPKDSEPASKYTRNILLEPGLFAKFHLDTCVLVYITCCQRLG